MIYPRIETTTIQIDRKTIRTHRIEKFFSSQIYKVKNAEVVHQNIKDNLSKYNQQKKPLQTLLV